jgi:hypothetical protein
LAAWRAWANKDGRSTVLLLSRAPDRIERRGMMLAGVREDGVLARPLNVRTPVQIFSAAGAAPQITFGATDNDAFRLIARIAGDR